MFQFIEYCKKGDIINAQKILSQNYSIKNANKKGAFRYSCINGYLNLAKWLYELNPNNLGIHDNNEYTFRHTCSHGKFDVAQWLYEITLSTDNQIDIRAGNDIAFKRCCVNGYLNIAQWLYSLLKPNELKVNIFTKYYYVFISSCSNKKDVAEWLYDLTMQNSAQIYEEYLSNPEIFNFDVINCAFVNSCKYGQLDTALLLYSLTEKLNYYKNIKIQVNIDFNLAFGECCKNNKLEMAQWIYAFSKSKNNKINIDNRNCHFTCCCTSGYFEMAKWLYTMSFTDGNTGIDIHEYNDYAFLYACINKHKDVAEWLYSIALAKKDIKSNNNIYSETVMQNIINWHQYERNKAIEWMNAICPDELKYI